MTSVFSRAKKFKEWVFPSGRVATIDASQAAAPPSPLAPIDLTDADQVAFVMDVAIRIGDILLSSGTANSDVKSQIHTVASSYGLHYCHVDITMNTITVFSHVGGKRRRPVSAFRVAGRMDVNFSKLSDVDRLIRSIQAGATPPEVADKILSDIIAAPPPYGAKIAVIGWATMAAAVSVLLGGNALVASLSFATTLAIMVVNILLDRQGMPSFFQNVFGGFVATLPAAFGYRLATELGWSFNPSQVIATGIIVLLAGLTLVQALQDGITGAPVTASARFFETMLITGGIIGGVALGIEVAAAIGVELPPIQTSPPLQFSSSVVKVAAGSLAAAAFAVASYAEWSTVAVAWLTGAAGFSLHLLVLQPLGVGALTSTAMSATMIGLAGGLLARRFLIPPLIIAISGVTPFLPGLAVYRGMYSMLNEQLINGFTYIALAIATAGGLAAGVVFGEWIARKLRRPPIMRAYRAIRRPRRYGTQAANEARSGIDHV
ncbi:threonine/serine exporter ThrE [Corynebacterium ciconiae]|uniref:threonine/serine exporter ThrE n=1 Tax=Corynebacterium ciconiae TaxID=227319 RepID=UPI00039C795D|nr:threonine/serine exporter family protein [Corynebacterium ciconiae]